MTPRSFHEARLLAPYNIFPTTIFIVRSLLQGQSRLERASKEKSEMAALQNA